jgi:hypothetical protein
MVTEDTDMFFIMLVMVALASIPLSFAIGFPGKAFRGRSIAPMHRTSR